jgi:NAD(P)H dehydrogenase (quinone)
MRVMVTIDHPCEQSYNHAILARVVDVLRGGGCEVDVLDLHREDFDPVLRVHEFAVYGQGKFSDPNVANYQGRIAQADHLIYISPVW